MFDYGILLYPSANRVYADASAALLRAELGVFGQALSTTPEELGERRLGGVTYVTFSTTARLSEEDVELLSNLSSLYALFELTGELLRPVEVAPLDEFGSDLLTIQKYAGKTNELFTRLLLNVTLLSTSDPTAFLREPLHVLDPLCGRGTTLNQAMNYGLDATGIELDRRDFDAYEQFVKTWLRTHRIKHTVESGQLRRNKVKLGQRLELAFAVTKEQYKAGELRHVTYYNCDTVTGADLLKAGSVDAIVTDAPYGVQHGSHRSQELSRNPRELLAQAVPAWVRTLRSGGALGISWNTNVTKRVEIAEILTAAGLEVRELGEFAHRVDQAILRDLLVARKP
ncbi:TRM11 family SAM-dependent methyltransferase [Amycolatopsis alkalitolerans]|uniref:SAM-dependent methyltransferase n=1 Tax=Amycolatopsis alkalitolerans TaxID=2547244 RepID=A0A5C4LUJ1_9PSEU|nr:SAM-dependent methyltransferase [Amycolatopsis alkalitolerans]TNC22598.1 SAM-dependent methyltransferase [Amycolatopsis alkalitolerans]